MAREDRGAPALPAPGDRPPGNAFALALRRAAGDNRRMVSVTLECAEMESEFLSAELWEEGAAGIQEEDLPDGRVRLRAWFDGAGALAERFTAYAPRVAEEAPVDWEAVSRQAWQPVEVGERFFLAPEWDESVTPPGRLRLTVHPGMALGTGAHPATQLALAALERHVKPGDRVLDVGTGSGILIEGACLLGAMGLGCDIEHASTVTAPANLVAGARPPRLFTGSLRAVAAHAADIIVANINAVTHQALAAEYTRVARRLLIVTGFPERHERGVAAALTLHGWEIADRLVDREWVCLVLRAAAQSAIY
jgi:ribosomal protein L11 methyltransferase